MRKRSPRILYLTSSWPHGQAFGGQLRALHIGRALRQIGDVTLSVISSDIPNEEALRRSGEDFRVAPAVPVLSRPDRTLFHRARRGLDTRYYLNVHGCAADPVARTRLFHSFASFDLIWILNSRTPNILNRWHWPKSHLDIDDIPSTYLRTVSRNASALRLRFKAQVQQALLKRRERRFSERFITQSVCSEEDKLYLGGGDQIHVIPNGYERPLTDPPRNPATSPPRIGFMGLCTYGPNLEGVKWFLRECWPAIRQAIPGIRFRLAGKGTTGPDVPTDSDVDALGWIDDPAAEIATWSATVIPIQFGGGTRIKIADAFSRKCPVVSTTIGAYGYAVEDGRQLRIADTPAAFSEACTRLVRSREEGVQLAQRAWQEFLQNWTWESIAPAVWTAAEDCLRRSHKTADVTFISDGPAPKLIPSAVPNDGGSTRVRRPMVSVGLPVYNGEKYLNRALDSICNQDFGDFELIISDNASTDGTEEICKTYAAKDRRIRYFRNEKNIGAIPNYRKVFELSQGEFFKWCAHDDVCHLSFLRRCVETFAGAPQSVVLVYPWCELIDEFGNVLEQASDHVDTRSKRPHQRLGRVIRRASYAYPIWGLIRSECLRKTALMGSVWYGDRLLLAELSLLGQIWEVPEVLSQLRNHPGNSVAICGDGHRKEAIGDLNRISKGSRQTLQTWTDPSAAPRRIWLPVREELCLEYLKRAHNAPLPRFEKLLCYFTVVTVSYWGRFAKRSGMWKKMLLASVLHNESLLP
jgi:glycosyltransferase involved in cell wall biosynthesis